MPGWGLSCVRSAVPEKIPDSLHGVPSKEAILDGRSAYGQPGPQAFKIARKAAARRGVEASYLVQCRQRMCRVVKMGGLGSAKHEAARGQVGPYHAYVRKPPGQTPGQRTRRVTPTVLCIVLSFPLSSSAANGGVETATTQTQQAARRVLCENTFESASWGDRDTPCRALTRHGWLLTDSCSREEMCLEDESILWRPTAV